MDISLKVGRLSLQRIPSFTSFSEPPPLLVCLLNYHFWAYFLLSDKSATSVLSNKQNCTENLSLSASFDCTAALRFLRSVAFLIQHHSDLVLAPKHNLIPGCIDWMQWSRLIARLRHQGLRCLAAISLRPAPPFSAWLSHPTVSSPVQDYDMVLQSSLLVNGLARPAGGSSLAFCMLVYRSLRRPCKWYSPSQQMGWDIWTLAISWCKQWDTSFGSPVLSYYSYQVWPVWPTVSVQRASLTDCTNWTARCPLAG